MRRDSKLSVLTGVSNSVDSCMCKYVLTDYLLEYTGKQTYDIYKDGKYSGKEIFLKVPNQL